MDHNKYDESRDRRRSWNKPDAMVPSKAATREEEQQAVPSRDLAAAMRAHHCVCGMRVGAGASSHKVRASPEVKT